MAVRGTAKRYFRIYIYSLYDIVLDDIHISPLIIFVIVMGIGETDYYGKIRLKNGYSVKRKNKKKVYCMTSVSPSSISDSFAIVIHFRVIQSYILYDSLIRI